MSFIEEQAKREVGSMKRLWRGFLWLCVISWAFYGVICIVSPLWPLGVILLAAAGYLGYRLKSKKKEGGVAG